MNTKHAILMAALLGVGSANTAMAFEAGDWLVRFGVSNIDPKSDNHPVVSVDSAFGATFNFTYMMTSHWAVELLAAYPYEHDLALVGGPEIGSTKHLPPTLSLQYHFLPDGGFQPYVGLGVNYTTFFSEDLRGPLAGSELSLDDSWGVAGEIGADFRVNDDWFLNLSVRYIDIETDARLDGASLGTVAIDPWVYGAHIGYRF